MDDGAHIISKHRIVSFKANVQGLLMKIEKNEQVLEERQIFSLIEKPVSEDEIIGTACGMDLFHCIYLGSKHGKDFVENIRSYFINNNPKDKRFKVEVSFYKKDRP